MNSKWWSDLRHNNWNLSKFVKRLELVASVCLQWCWWQRYVRYSFNVVTVLRCLWQNHHIVDYSSHIGGTSSVINKAKLSHFQTATKMDLAGIFCKYKITGWTNISQLFEIPESSIQYMYIVPSWISITLSMNKRMNRLKLEDFSTFTSALISFFWLFYPMEIIKRNVWFFLKRSRT